MGHKHIYEIFIHKSRSFIHRFHAVQHFGENLQNLIPKDQSMFECLCYMGLYMWDIWTLNAWASIIHLHPHFCSVFSLQICGSPINNKWKERSTSTQIRDDLLKGKGMVTVFLTRIYIKLPCDAEHDQAAHDKAKVSWKII